MFNWIRSFFPSKPEPTEIQKIEMALMKHESKIRDMQRHWAEVNGICCPGCMFGSRYYGAIDRAERTEAWLKILRKKKNDFRKR